MKNCPILRILSNELFVSQEDIEALDDDTNLLESGIIDSFGFVQLLMLVAEESNVDFDFEATPPEQLSILGELRKTLRNPS